MDQDQTGGRSFAAACLIAANILDQEKAEMPAGATGLTVKIACVRSRTLLNLSAAVPIKLSDEAFRPERG
ncbi:hypothetical protein Rhsp01_21190 [Rhizobium sp. NBRC 114257]|uniref:Uncharacterized protein n=1 Tax=Rhizobium dioscoreae TaxID=2653122 RepID=A0ABQ0Z2M1_9HYPH|nr:hypothetical protein RsS93_21160 [Rhizobium dioscoreae]GLU80943.1 hypothetical protein Rhsp01_21190 [Rhizobium sp. NBRC 114257]